MDSVTEGDSAAKERTRRGWMLLAVGMGSLILLGACDKKNKDNDDDDEEEPPPAP